MNVHVVLHLIVLGNEFHWIITLITTVTNIGNLSRFIIELNGVLTENQFYYEAGMRLQPSALFQKNYANISLLNLYVKLLLSILKLRILLLKALI